MCTLPTHTSWGCGFAREEERAAARLHEPRVLRRRACAHAAGGLRDSIASEALFRVARHDRAPPFAARSREGAQAHAPFSRSSIGRHEQEARARGALVRRLDEAHAHVRALRIELGAFRIEQRPVQARHEHLDVAAARQPYLLGARRRSMEALEAGLLRPFEAVERRLDDAALDAAARHRPGDAAPIAHRHHRPRHARRGSPGLSHLGQGHVASGFEPSGHVVTYLAHDAHSLMIGGRRNGIGGAREPSGRAGRSRLGREGWSGRPARPASALGRPRRTPRYLALWQTAHSSLPRFWPSWLDG